ncbi:hypothetical protein TIFTF001_025512 [Ficus carica]|uniref:RanBP2-type domain-containing protein n=1 Tax=Ficus carica TaxID=3494 RepID=A0AA88DFL4_FICCA|nr:hypothetical protein TIFTF001_025512 [Ficus carica]
MASAKVDNRSSFGSKRSRNDDSRADGDWTCPDCGNVNFGFRTVCNRAKCGAPRPSFFPTHGPMTSQYSNPPPFYIGGFGAPPMLYGSPIPPSGFHYSYGIPPHGTYGPVPTFLPGGFEGMGYRSQPAMNGYGFGFHGSPWSGGILPDNSTSRKRRGGPDGLYEGDWTCPRCTNVNFAFRTVCNIKKCGAARPFPGPNLSNVDAPEGSWTCGKCGFLNYPFRTVCNRKECGSEKPTS